MLSGAVNPLSTVIAFIAVIIFSVKYFAAQSLRMLLLLLLYSLFTVSSIWSVYSIVAWTQGPAYLFSFLYLFSSHD